MNHPWQHPDSGIYWYRKRVPERLKPLVGKTEEKISLRTRDPDEARIEFARISLEVEERWRRLSAGLRSLSEREAAGMAGEIYRVMVEEHGDNPSSMPGRSLALMLDQAAIRPGSIQMVPFGNNPDAVKVLTERLFANRAEQNAQRIDDWLKTRGLLLDPESRKMVSVAVDKAILNAREHLARMAGGDYSDDPAASRFPKFELQKPKDNDLAKPKACVSFDEIIDAKAEKKRTGKNSKPLPEKSISKYKRIAREFATFRGSDDATTTTVDEVDAWGDAMLEAALLGNRTIADKLTNLGTIINWGRGMRKYREPMASAEIITGRIELPEWEEKPADETSYTMDEARHVMRKARDETESRTRWLPWICLYAGLRISEANALRKEDFFQCEGRWFFRVTTRGGRTLKTNRSERKIPVHPALEGEGFLHWVRAAEDGRLFAPGATSFVGRWVRGDSVGITREEISPNHGLRHLFVDLCRRDGVQDEPREYLSGHASAKVHRKYGATDVMLPGLAAEMDKIMPLLPIAEKRAE
jgi:integrase